jgi:hypothetical protein
MENSFENARFRTLVADIRRIMPGLAVSLLVLVYAISAAASGLFLSAPGLLGKTSWGIFLAYCIGVCIQLTRMTLVFFRELNPIRPTTGHQGEFIAVVMGIISIVEVYHLANANGMAFPVVLSLAILMMAGIGIEVFLLRELKFFNELQLFDKPEYWQKIERYHQAKAEFVVRMDAIRNGQRIRKPITAPAMPSAMPVNGNGHQGGHDQENFTIPASLAAMPASRNGNGNGKHIAGIADDH